MSQQSMGSKLLIGELATTLDVEQQDTGKDHQLHQ